MQKDSLLQVASTRPVLLDGGMGTMLFEKGLEHGHAPELWNVDQPDDVADIHRQYLNAGSDAILTNTFGGTSVKLADHDLEKMAHKINYAAARLARSVCVDGKYVIGDIGPTGKLLEPYGDLQESVLQASLEEQIGALIDGGVDAILFETQMDMQEALFGIKVAKNLCSLPVIASFTFNKTKRGFFTLMGNSVLDVMRGATFAGADIVGANCGLDSIEMAPLIQKISEATGLPIFAKPNAGMPELKNGHVHYSQPLDEFLEPLSGYLEEGTKLIGGCCGTGPDHIRGIRKLIPTV